RRNEMRFKVNSLAFAAAFTRFLAGATAVACSQIRAQGQAQNQPQAQAPHQDEQKILQDPKHPIIAIGAPAPDFDLPGVDGKNHKLSDYADAKVLVVLFECNHCPFMQGYEERVRQINDTYKSRGVALVAINANSPQGLH